MKDKRKRDCDSNFNRPKVWRQKCRRQRVWEMKVRYIRLVGKGLYRPAGIDLEKVMFKVFGRQ